MPAKKELVYDELPLGKEFKPYIFNITKDFLEKFTDTVSDHSPIYNDPKGVIAPNSIAGIYARSAYLGEDYSMPPGGVLLRLDFEFYNPARLGDTLTSKARVISREIKDEKRRVTFEINTTNQDKLHISTVRIFALWPK